MEGQEAIYTSAERSLPLLEKLAHLRKDEIPADLAMMALSIKGEWQVQGNSLAYSTTGGAMLWFTTLRSARDAFLPGGFVGLGDPFAVALPSVIVPAWNLVLYPKARAFWDHVSLVEVAPFSYDPRLFPTGATSEKET